MSSNRKIICTLHDNYCSHICVAPNCSSRIICNNCFVSHDSYHLKFFKPLLDFHNGKILDEISNGLNMRYSCFMRDNELIEECFDNLMKETESQIRKVKNQVYETLIEKYQRPTLLSEQDVKAFFRSLFKNSELEKELDFLAKEIEKIEKFSPNNIKISVNDEFLNSINHELQILYSKYPEVFSFSKESLFNKENIKKIYSYKSKGVSLLSNIFDIDDKLMVVASSDSGNIDVFGFDNVTQEIKQLKTLESQNPILAVKALFKFNKVIAASNGLIFIYDLNDIANTKPTQIYSNHLSKKNIYSLEHVSLNESEFMLSGGNDKKLRIWHLKNLRDHQIFDLTHEIGQIKVFKPNYCILGNKGGEILIFRYSENGKFYFNYSQKVHNDWICSFDFISERSLIVTGSNDSRLYIWKMNDESLDFIQDASLNNRINKGFIRGVNLLSEENIILYSDLTQNFNLYNLSSENTETIISLNDKITTSYISKNHNLIFLGDIKGIVNIFSWN